MKMSQLTKMCQLMTKKAAPTMDQLNAARMERLGYLLMTSGLLGGLIGGSQQLTKLLTKPKTKKPEVMELDVVEPAEPKGTRLTRGDTFDKRAVTNDELTAHEFMTIPATLGTAALGIGGGYLATTTIGEYLRKLKAKKEAEAAKRKFEQALLSEQKLSAGIKRASENLDKKAISLLSNTAAIAALTALGVGGMSHAYVLDRLRKSEDEEREIAALKAMQEFQDANAAPQVEIRTHKIKHAFLEGAAKGMVVEAAKKNPDGLGEELGKVAQNPKAFNIDNILGNNVEAAQQGAQEGLKGRMPGFLVQ
jgi:Na+/glutamate symporter